MGRGAGDSPGHVLTPQSCLQIGATGSVSGSLAMVAAAVVEVAVVAGIPRGAVSGTTSTSSTGTKIDTTGIIGTLTPTALATGLAACPARGHMNSTAATATTGDTGTTMTGGAPGKVNNSSGPETGCLQGTRHGHCPIQLLWLHLGCDFPALL